MLTYAQLAKQEVASLFPTLLKPSSKSTISVLAPDKASRRILFQGIYLTIMENSLLYAAYFGNEQRVERLLRIEGIQVNQPSKEGCTPLILASWRGHVGVVEQLLKFEGKDEFRLGIKYLTILAKIFD